MVCFVQIEWLVLFGRIGLCVGRRKTDFCKLYGVICGSDMVLCVGRRRAGDREKIGL